MGARKVWATPGRPPPHHSFLISHISSRASLTRALPPQTQSPQFQLLHSASQVPTSTPVTEPPHRFPFPPKIVNILGDWSPPQEVISFCNGDINQCFIVKSNYKATLQEKNGTVHKTFSQLNNKFILCHSSFCIFRVKAETVKCMTLMHFIGLEPMW